MPLVGQIISWPKYPFPDGLTHDKLFIVLNDSNSSGEPCLLLLVTKQEKHFPGFIDGCNTKLKCFHIPLTWGEPFRVPTFVVFPRIIETTCQRIWAMSNVGVHPLKRKISDACMDKIKECFKRFNDDISEEHRVLIFT